MQIRITYTLRVVITLLLLLPASATPQSGSEALHKFFAEFFEERISDQPEFATAIGRHDYDDRWTDWSKAGCERRRAHIQRRLRELDRFPLVGLSGQDRLSARLLRYELRQDLESYDLETYLWGVNQLFGLHNRIYLAVDRMPGRTVRDYENIIARLRGVPPYVDRSIALLNEATQRRLVQPGVVVDLVTKQIAAQAAQDQAATLLLTAFRRFPSNIPNEQQAKLRT